MGLNYTPKQKWSLGAAIIGLVGLLFHAVFENAVGEAIEDAGGTMKVVTSIILSPWLPFVIAFGGFIFWCVFSLQLKREQQENTIGHYAKFMEAWDGLRMTRRAFEEKIGTLYASWSRNPPDLNAVKDLIDKAGYPVGLPLKEGEHIWQYAVEATREWEGARRTLSDFCMVVYVRQDNRLMPNKGERDEFDDMRMKLSKFWDVWGAKCFNEKTMDKKRVLATVRGQGWMILLLIYLEVTRAYHYKTTDVGKSWLFMFGREVVGLNNK